jgi:hypothetical protein
VSSKPSFWRRLLGASAPESLTPEATPEPEQQRPVPLMSPIETFVAGGGDMGSAGPGVQALMWEAEKGHQRGEERRQRPDRERHTIRERQVLDRTEPATLGQYVTWLNGYIERGGHPTHYYDYPFTGFTYALSDVMVDSDAEFGAKSRSIIVPRGRKISRTNPDAYFNGWGHTDLFLMDDYQTHGIWVPVYSDPEFDTLLTDEHREERARQERRSADLRAGRGRR